MEVSNKDQTDDILFEKLHGLEMEAPLHVFQQVQEKRKRKVAAFWLFGMAAMVLVSIVFVWQFAEPKPTKVQEKLVVNTPKVEKVLVNKSAEKSDLAEPRMERPMKLNTLAKSTKVPISEPIKTSYPQPEAVKPKIEIEKVPATAKIEKAEPIAFSANSVKGIPKFDSLETQQSKEHIQVCEQVVIPDSVLNKEPIKFSRNNWFVGIGYTQTVFSTQQAYNSKSVLVFGDSSQEHDKPLSSWRFDGYFGRTFSQNWYYSAGISYLKTTYASVSKAEQDSSILNLSTGGHTRLAYQTDAVYFDESLIYLALPLEIGYCKSFGKWQVLIGLGPQLTYLYRTSSYKASTTIGYAPEHLQDAKNERFTNYIFSLQEKCLVSYPILQNCYVVLGVQGQQNLQNTFQSSYYNDHKANLFGVQVGLKYYLP
ncbi:MAG: hypothetical protein CFE21_15395 [Bacteroidetes bacterium B1(2017)]|nr:MAG: hypothetical protein CFE21_15395 [Bacteroidetes bacterium B1(2017)]